MESYSYIKTLLESILRLKSLYKIVAAIIVLGRIRWKTNCIITVNSTLFNSFTLFSQRVHRSRSAARFGLSNNSTGPKSQ